MPLYFDVLCADAMLKCEVLVESNLVGERSLGSLSVRCPGLHVCGEPSSKRYTLAGVPHGELELKLAFVRWEPPRAPSPSCEERAFAPSATTIAQGGQVAALEPTAAPTTPLKCESAAVPSSLACTLAAPEAQTALDAANQFSVHWAVSWRTTRMSAVVASLAIVMAVVQLATPVMWVGTPAAETAGVAA
eukprot:CAMPEP_0172762644 /NCGR_PEP_ID=MMETSP1074-20121228/173911_1 /TAXON_ID=2916 /ORGANISM="Ceratium fusus, Strain PA161109" /LENGTH=189 /DNA_ID=CAMNT_0013597081 /DNA_START=55 /DNA_END=620 /DNA_ORIENTATION=-